jgi:hypothetical protein
MKTKLLLFTLSCFALQASAQRIQSSCTAPDSVKAIYQNDADQMALRRINENRFPAKDSINIPFLHSDSILKVLLAVYNLKTAEADTVARILKLHAFPKYGLKNCAMFADSTAYWMVKLRNKITPCGQSTIDALINTYNLKYSYSTSGFNASHIVNFSSEKNLNISKMAEMISRLPGVNMVFNGGYAGGGFDISSKWYDDHIELLYQYGWGDCPSGCIYSRFWKFNIYPDCSVEFVTSYGDKLPNTSIEQASKPSIALQPNPFSNTFTITNTQGPVHIKIINMQSALVYDAYTQSNELNDLGDLAPGLYYVQIIEANKNTWIKAIKN